MPFATQPCLHLITNPSLAFASFGSLSHRTAQFGTRKPAPVASSVKPAATPAASSSGVANKKLADFYNVKASASKRFKVVLKFVGAYPFPYPESLSYSRWDH